MNQERELQQNQFEMQILGAQIQQVEQQIQMLGQQTSDLNLLAENLSELDKVESKTDIVVPLGAGIFIEAKLKESREILMNVGSGVMTKKSFTSAQEILTKQSNDLVGLMKQMEGNLSELHKQLHQKEALLKEK
jgi:prefoldin alpha subunit